MADDVTVSPDLRGVVLAYEKKPTLRTAWTFRVDVDRMVNTKVNMVDFDTPATLEYVWRKLKSLWDNRLLIVFYPPSVELDPLKVCITDMPATFEDFRAEVAAKGYIDVQLIELIGENEHDMRSKTRDVEGVLAIVTVGQDIYVQTSDTTWVRQSNMGGAHEFGKLSHTYTGHWLYQENDIGATSDMWYSSNGVDFIETWTHFRAGNGEDSGVQDYDIGPDGTVWIVVGTDQGRPDGNDYTPLCVYKSVDGGASWILVYTDAGYTYTGYWHNMNTGPRLIAANQQDANIVVVCCEGRFNKEPDSIYTIDGGVNWIRRVNPAQDFPRGAGVLDDMRFVANGRLLYLHSQTTCSVWYSDTLGETWTKATETTAFNSPVGRQLGWWKPEWGNNSIMICDRPLSSPNPQYVKVFVSKNNGASWDKVDTSDPTFAWVAVGVDYDAATNRLAVLRYVNTGVGAIDDPFGTPVKSDITGDLPSSLDPYWWAIAYPR